MGAPSMKSISRTIVLLASISALVSCYNPNVATGGRLSRRNLLSLIGTTAAVVVPSTIRAAAAEEAGGLTDVYFGVGCFWHIQHEFIQAERDILGRNDHQLTSRSGYAGGKATDSEGRVCYHNLQSIADYGKLGHGEAVEIRLPEDKIADFAQVYFDLFDPRTKDRVDPMDRGAEYRSVMGLPSGTQHPVYPKIEAIASKAGFKLQQGKGNDPDTLGKQIVYVYDSNKFPFYQAEVYHQYHNDFQSPPYGRSYNQLADLALSEGRIQNTACPYRLL